MKKNNKLVFFYPSIEIGGLTKNLFSLVNSLSKKNYHIYFITFKDNKNNKTLKKLYPFSRKIKILTPKYFFFTNNRYLKYFFCFLTLITFCLKNKYLIISFQSNVLSILAGILTNNKVIIRCNTAPSKYISSYIKKYFFKLVYSQADKILVTSFDFQKEIKKYFNLKSIVHQQSLDELQIKKKSKEKVNFKFFKKYKHLKIINVGRLTDQKDLITLLKAFLKLIKIRKARLLMIGNGTDYEKISNFISKNNLKDKVKIINFQTNPYKYISLSDIKVLSSKFEGNPNILLEIACLKKLIISSNCKVGPSEILQRGKGGLLFKVGDHNKLYNLLKNVKINDIHIKKKINFTYNYVNINFKKDIGNTFINILREI